MRASAFHNEAGGRFSAGLSHTGSEIMGDVAALVTYNVIGSLL